MVSREKAPRSMARSTRCQPQRRCTTKGKTARARLPLVWTRRPVIMTIRTMPMQKAVPDGKGWIRLCTAAAARDTGSVLGSGGTDPVSLAAAAVHSLIQPLPSGTAFCIGIVLIVMMTGRLVQTKGSLARAVLPFVVHLRWGWHRVERAMERGAFSLDTMFDQAMDWCMRQLPVEPVRLGMAQREVNAIDSSTIVRLRAGKRLALAGKGYCHRAGRAVRADILAALTTVVMIEGVRVGLVRRTRFGASCEEAVARVFEDLPPAQGKRLLVVDAGIATKEQFAAATAQDALLGRLRINTKLRCAPPPPTGQPGRRPVHGAVLHPGRPLPEVAPDVDRHIPGEAGLIRLRRWHR